MSILLGDVETSYLNGKIVGLAVTGPIFAVISEETALIRSPNPGKLQADNQFTFSSNVYSLSIWICANGLECLGRGSISPRSPQISQSPDKASSADSLIGTPQREINLQFKSDGQRLVIVLDDELIYVDLVWLDKRYSKQISYADLLDLVSQSTGPKSKFDSPYLKEIISLKLQKSQRLKFDGLSCVLKYDQGKTLLVCISSTKLIKVAWDGSIIQSKPSIDNSISTLSNIQSYEPVLHVIGQPQTFEMTSKVYIDPTQSSEDGLLDFGHVITYGSWSEQLRLFSFCHGDGSFSVARLVSTGYLSTRHIFPVIDDDAMASPLKPSKGPISSTEIPGRIISLAVIDYRQGCDTNTTLLAVVLRTPVSPLSSYKTERRSTLRLKTPFESHNDDVKFNDALIVFSLSVLSGAHAEIELKMLHLCDLGCMSSSSHKKDPSLIIDTGLSLSPRGPIILLYNSCARTVTAHGLLLPTMSLFKIDLNSSISFSDITLCNSRLILTALERDISTSDISTLINIITWKPSLRCSDGIYLDKSEDEWFLEMRKTSSNLSSTGSSTNNKSYQTSILYSDYSSTSFNCLIRETNTVEMKSRISVSSRLRIELSVYDRNLIVAETISSSSRMETSYQFPSYLAAIAEVSTVNQTTLDDKSKSSTQSVSLSLWLHNKYTRRWRGTNIDVDSGSKAMLIDPLMPSAISNDAYSQSSSLLSDKPLAHKNNALNGPFINGAIAIKWFSNHSIILLAIRKNRCCLEVISKEINSKNPTNNSSFPRPNIHYILPLAPGAMPISMAVTLCKPFVLPKETSIKSLKPLPNGVLVSIMGDVSISVYHVIAFVKSSDLFSSDPSIIDYSVQLICDVSYHHIHGLRLPLQKVVPITIDGQIDSLSLMAIDSTGAAIQISRTSASPETQSNGDISDTKQLYIANVLSNGRYLDLRVEEISNTYNPNDDNSSNSNQTADTIDAMGKCLQYVFFVSQENLTFAESTHSLIYIPHLKMLLPSPSLPQLSCYTGLQKNMLVCVKESTIRRMNAEDENHLHQHMISDMNTAASMRLSLGSVRCHVDSNRFAPINLKESPSIISPLVIHEISIPIHIFIGIINQITSAMMLRRNNETGSYTDHHVVKVEGCIAYIDRFLGLLSLRHGRQVFAEDLEYYIIQLSHKEGFKSTTVEYRVICCLLYTYAPHLLIQIITRIIRKLEIELAQKLFPIPISLSSILSAFTTTSRSIHVRIPKSDMLDPNIKSLSPLSLFQLCLWPDFGEVNPSTTRQQLQPQRLLNCSTRLLTFTCEYEGGTETFRSTERSLALTLELMNESSNDFSLRVCVHSLDFACRLEDVLNSIPISMSNDYARFDNDDRPEFNENESAMTIGHNPRISCNERIWRESSLLSTFGMVSPALSYLVGGGALWMVGKTLGVVAAAVTDTTAPTTAASSITPPQPVILGERDGNRYRTYVSCSRFITASRLLRDSTSSMVLDGPATTQGEIPSERMTSQSCGSLIAAFVVLKCADFMKVKRYIASSIFAASIITSDLAKSKIREYIKRENILASMAADDSMGYTEHMLQDETEIWNSIMQSFQLVSNNQPANHSNGNKAQQSNQKDSLHFSLFTLRAMCCEEARKDLRQSEPLINFDLPDMLLQQIALESSEKLTVDFETQKTKQKNCLFVSRMGFIPRHISSGMALSLLLTGKPRLCIKFVTDICNFHSSTNDGIIDWILQ